jgi:hypothetical protein
MSPDDEGSKHLWNVGKILVDYTAQLPGRQSSSYSPPWEHQISWLEDVCWWKKDMCLFSMDETGAVITCAPSGKYNTLTATLLQDITCPPGAQAAHSLPFNTNTNGWSVSLTAIASSWSSSPYTSIVRYSGIRLYYPSRARNNHSTVLGSTWIKVCHKLTSLFYIDKLGCIVKPKKSQNLTPKQSKRIQLGLI